MATTRKDFHSQGLAEAVRARELAEEDEDWGGGDDDWSSSGGESPRRVSVTTDRFVEPSGFELEENSKECEARLSEVKISDIGQTSTTSDVKHGATMQKVSEQLNCISQTNIEPQSIVADAKKVFASATRKAPMPVPAARQPPSLTSRPLSFPRSTSGEKKPTWVKTETNMLPVKSEIPKSSGVDEDLFKAARLRRERIAREEAERREAERLKLNEERSREVRNLQNLLNREPDHQFDDEATQEQERSSSVKVEDEALRIARENRSVARISGRFSSPNKEYIPQPKEAEATWRRPEANESMTSTNVFSAEESTHLQQHTSSMESDVAADSNEPGIKTERLHETVSDGFALSHGNRTASIDESGDVECNGMQDGILPETKNVNIVKEKTDFDQVAERDQFNPNNTGNHEELDDDPFNPADQEAEHDQFNHGDTGNDEELDDDPFNPADQEAEHDQLNHGDTGNDEELDDDAFSPHECVSNSLTESRDCEDTDPFDPERGEQPFVVESNQQEHMSTDEAVPNEEQTSNVDISEENINTQDGHETGETQGAIENSETESPTTSDQVPTDCCDDSAFPDEMQLPQIELETRDRASKSFNSDILIEQNIAASNETIPHETIDQEFPKPSDSPLNTSPPQRSVECLNTADNDQNRKDSSVSFNEDSEEKHDTSTRDYDLTTSVDEIAPKLSFIAVYDFVAQEPEDLGMLEGDLIDNVTELDGQWYRGRNTRTNLEGVFPKSYVEDHDNTSEHVSQVESSLAVETPQPSAEDVQEAKDEIGYWAIALFDFDAADASAGELHFVAGDRLFLQEQVDENWFNGYREIDPSVIGLIPCSYAQRIEEDAPEAATTGEDDEYYVAEYDFAGEEAEDLAFSEGDVIRILRHEDEDWCIGELNGKQGLVPLQYLRKNGDELDAEHDDGDC